MVSHMADYVFVYLRQPGIEPGPHAWEARILTIELLTLVLLAVKNKNKFNQSFQQRTHRDLNPDQEIQSLLC